MAIEIDIPQRKLNLKLSDDEFRGRLEKWKMPEPKVKKGFLTIYARLTEPPEKGVAISRKLALKKILGKLVIIIRESLYIAYLTIFLVV